MKTNKTSLYTHTGNGGPVRAETAEQAAAILARRMYGKRGTVGALRLDSSAMDGSTATYEAFVGVGPTQAERRRGANGITGRNIWIYA